MYLSVGWALEGEGKNFTSDRSKRWVGSHYWRLLSSGWSSLLAVPTLMSSEEETRSQSYWESAGIRTLLWGPKPVHHFFSVVLVQAIVLMLMWLSKGWRNTDTNKGWDSCLVICLIWHSLSFSCTRCFPEDSQIIYPKHTDILGGNSIIVYTVFPGTWVFIKFCADRAEGSQGKSATSGGLQFSLRFPF